MTFNTMLKLTLVFVVICFVLMAEARKLHARRHQDTELHGREFLKVGLMIEEEEQKLEGDARLEWNERQI